MLIYADKVFENSVETIEAFLPNQVKPALDKIESLKNKGLYLVGYMRYNLKSDANNLPLLYFEAFDSFKPFVQKVPDYTAEKNTLGRLPISRNRLGRVSHTK